MRPSRKLRLDLACGEFCRPGHTAVDIALPAGADNIGEAWVLADLFAPSWPFATSSVQGVNCSHFVEHVPDLVAFMDELWRILEPDGRATITHPYQYSRGAWQDPTHVRALNENSWLYYSREWRRSSGLGHYPIRCDFAVDDLVPVGSGRYAHMARAQLFAEAAHSVNVIDDLRVSLIAIKRGR